MTQSLQNTSDLTDTQYENYIMQMEIFCSLNFGGNPTALERQERNRKRLYKFYTTGKIKDRWKAKIYQPTSVQASSTDKLPLLRTENFHTGFRLFDRTRLFLLRAYHVVLAAPDHSLDSVAVPLAFIGLASGLRLLVDTAMLLKTLVFPDADEKKQAWRERVKNKFNKGDRRKRMYNDLFWFPVNLLGIVLMPLTFGISFVVLQFLQLSGFGWDTVNESLKSSGRKRAVASESLLKYIGRKKSKFSLMLSEIEQKLSALDVVNPSEEIQQERSLLLNQKESYQSSVRDYVHMEGVVRKAAQREKSMQNYNIFTTAMVCVGMGFYIFSATLGVNGLMLAGACITLVFGSLLNGIGKEIYEKVPTWFSGKKKVGGCSELALKQRYSFTAEVHNRLGAMHESRQEVKPVVSVASLTQISTETSYSKSPEKASPENTPRSDEEMDSQISILDSRAATPALN